MNVLFASAEVAPFAKAGGLGDVVGSLPKYLRKQGVDARVLMPQYGFIPWDRYSIRPAFSFQYRRHTGMANVYISYTEYDGVPIYFAANWPYFGEGNHLYTSWSWDVPRFICFSEIILATIYNLSLGPGGLQPWQTDMLHVHDWHTALAPFMVDHSRGNHQLWRQMGTMLTIHNMGYQGNYAAGFLWEAGTPYRANPDLTYQNLGDNLLACGIAYADMVTTVSPRYAVELQYPRFGEGLQDLARIRAQRGDLSGILNGLDMERFDPATDKALVQNFNADDFIEVRPENKLALQQQLGLPVREDVPMVGVVSRLTDQKGFDLALPALRRLLEDTDVQLVALGSGESYLEHDLWRLQQDFGWKARAILSYDPALSQRIYASSDLFLMPSRYEPCGTSQMLAMRYGSLPLVRETGGLADTVQNYDNGNADSGTGFVFMWETPDAVHGTLNWAINTFRERRDVFRRMQKRAMTIDFGWEKSAKTYIELYERCLARHRK